MKLISLAVMVRAQSDAAEGAARQAFRHGLHLAFAICAVLTLAAAVAAATLLRQRRPSEPGPEPEFQPGAGQVTGQARPDCS